MISIEEMEPMLDEIASELPQELYKDLNGGIMLLPEVKLHDKSKRGGLYILGEYHRDKLLGRYIAIYYGSFVQGFSHLSKDQLKEELKNTLKHEFIHHLESMAGDRSLEIKDAQNLARYLDNSAGWSK
jgi:hypothetical protein